MALIQAAFSAELINLNYGVRHNLTSVMMSFMRTLSDFIYNSSTWHFRHHVLAIILKSGALCAQIGTTDFL